VFEHHGDYQCDGVPDGPGTSTSGGIDCLTESVPDGYGKLITMPLGLEGDINDVRPANSSVLEWYYQLSARWVPKLECSDYPPPGYATHPAGGAPSTGTGTGTTSGQNKKEKEEEEQGTAGSTVPNSAIYPRPKAMSFHNYAGPGDLNRKQSSYVFTYQVPLQYNLPIYIYVCCACYAMLCCIIMLLHTLLCCILPFYVLSLL
jgi:hypothetical protein